MRAPMALRLLLAVALLLGAGQSRPPAQTPAAGRRRRQSSSTGSRDLALKGDSAGHCRAVGGRHATPTSSSATMTPAPTALVIKERDRTPLRAAASACCSRSSARAASKRGSSPGSWTCRAGGGARTRRRGASSGSSGCRSSPGCSGCARRAAAVRRPQPDAEGARPHAADGERRGVRGDDARRADRRSSCSGAASWSSRRPTRPSARRSRSSPAPSS